ncbi:HTH_Tnp_Tc3_2 domain-containing protein [Trichonephila clavipes]|nr:HTH_Tnp_Tc3_2 domain-containing protein [Trichonephila clavipes]
MQKWSDLSDVQKGFRVQGGSISETAKFVNCLCAAMVKEYCAWKNGSDQNQRRDKCAPLAIADRDEQRLRRYIRENRRATFEILTTQMNQGATNSLPS